MVNTQKLMALGAGSVIALAAVAQVIIPPCCKYLWEWPPEFNPPPPGGGCSGTHSFVCQTGAQNVWDDDPEAQQKRYTFVEAKCFQVELKGSAHFVRLDCSDPPPPGEFIGVLPNGQCCYAVGLPQDITIVPYDAGYEIRLCLGQCDDGEN